MRKLAAFVFALGSFGCVNLDKPTSLAECSTAPGGCVDSGKRDAALRTDGGDAGTPDAQADATGIASDADALGLPDGPLADTQQVRPDSADLGGIDVASDAVAPLVDALAADLRADDVPADRAADFVPADGAPDLADGATEAAPPTPADASDATSPPDKPVPTDTADAATPADKPDVATTVVTFKSGRGDGVMTGYGWVTLGASDTVTSPTCGSASAAITSAAPCTTQTNWSSPTALCVSGSIPALPEVPTSTDYANNWGLQVGVNAKEPNAAIGQAFTSIALNISGTPATGLRVELHRAGDAVGTTYCALWTSNEPIPLTSFNTECWNNNGVSLTAADAATIDKVGLQVTSGPAAIAVTELCMQSIVFGK